MVTKNKTAEAGAGKNKGRVRVGKLKLNKETLTDLTAGDYKKIKGGAAPVTRACPNPVPLTLMFGCQAPTQVCSATCATSIYCG